MAVRIKDVARHAGVSSATVSRVLANKPHISQETRKRVLAAVEELNYRPSSLARSLRKQRSDIIGLIISDIQNPFFTSLVRAVEDIAYECQYGVFLCNSDESIEKESMYIDLMLSQKVAGVVISATREENNPSRRLVEADVPVVAVDRRMVDLEVDTVVVDNILASFDLVSHLISDGHERIAAVVGPPTTTTGRERREGYLKAMAAHSLPIPSDFIRTGPPKEEWGYKFTYQLLNQSNSPTALFTGNNLLTIGALRAINDYGLRIPDDIALVAFDEIEWMTLVKPHLTVVAQPTYKLGQTAGELLFERLENNGLPPREIVLNPTLLIRHSCADHG